MGIVIVKHLNKIIKVLLNKEYLILILVLLSSSFESIYPAAITINTNVIYSSSTHAGNDITVGSGGTFTINSNAQVNTIRVNNGGILIINAPYTLTVGIISNNADFLVVDFQNGSTVTLQSGASLVVYGLLNNSNNSTGITLNGVVSVFGNVTAGAGSLIVGTGSISATGTIISANNGQPGLIFGTPNDCLTGPCGASLVCPVSSKPLTPTISSITHPTCSVVNGSFTITNYDASYIYSINPSTGVSQIGAIVTAPSETYTISASSGNCSSLPLTQVIINAQPIAPTITNTSPNSRCGTGTVTLGATASAGTINWYSTATGGISLGSGNSYTTPSISTTTTYYVDATNNGCTTASRTAVTATINTTNTWTGATDSDWNKISNWTCGVPASNSNIIIPDVANKPLLNIDVTLENLEIQPGAILNVANNGLTITGTLTLNGKIDLQNESQLIQIDGSLLTVDCSNNGSIEIDQQGTPISYYFNYWGSPVYSNCATKKYTILGVLRDGSFPENIKVIDFGFALTYADTKRVPTNDSVAIKISSYWMNTYRNRPAGNYNHWTYVGNSGELLIGEGFTMKGSNRTITEDQNYTFVGKPNNGTITLPINNNNQYLVGNPYPSAIDANKFIDDNITTIDGTLYFWDHAGPESHYLADYGLGYATYSKAGGIPAGGSIPNFDIPGRKRPKQFIPVAQGFFVNGIASGNIEFKNSQRAFEKDNIFSTNSTFIRTTGKSSITKKQNEEKDLTPRIYLSYNSPMGYQRILLAAFIPNTTKGFDIGYDARNIDQFKEDMYWKVDNANLVIQAVPSILNSVLPFELKLFTNGNAKISLASLENIPTDVDIFIRDKESGAMHNLRTAAFEVNLNPGTYTQRFELVLQPQKTLEIAEENLVENNVTIFFNQENSLIYIRKTQNIEVKEIRIYNMIGQQLKFMNTNLDKNSIEIPFSFESGVYIVTVKTNQGTSTKKVLNY